MNISTIGASRAAIIIVALMRFAAIAGAQQANDVQVRTSRISNNFYTLEGNGGMVGVLTGPDGVLMVDTQFAPMSEKLVAAHRAMILAIRDKVAPLVKQGKTLEEVVAAKLTSDYDAKVTGATPMTADRFIGQLYAEAKAGR